MNKHLLHIENMVCQRCVLAVEEACRVLEIEIEKVELGKIHLPKENTISAAQKQLLNEKLQKTGLKLIESDKKSLISAIKTAIIHQIHYEEKPLQINFSEYLSENLHHEYSYLSRLFSTFENTTIEKYIALQKIERAKELLSLKKYRISEIAHQLHYKSTSHFSTQFKDMTGQTPSQYKKNPIQGRKMLDLLKKSQDYEIK
ncbi:helix-turn-helix transcriptional regulator [Bernardetia sp.]|uniref:helix-turn-helix transcriptional regulator n=1 Tax=Bernardetia sp. TaxID=1937974 RepID=UPI0025BC0688|nr:helix-turn-helix transcriptional regulator [Bernardetia sp.]